MRRDFKTSDDNSYLGFACSCMISPLPMYGVMRCHVEQVVPACGGDLDGALGVVLTLDLGEVALEPGMPGP